MKRTEHIAMIAHDMGLIFEFLGIASLLPFLVLLAFGEWALLLPMATAPFTFLVLGYIISHLPYRDIEPSLSVTLSAVTLSWLSIALIGALPFVFGLGMSYTDSVFEAMSGWTGTGFSMILSLEAAPHTLLFWRSLNQWVGGIGIIAFAISLRRKTRISLFRMYRAEGREEELVPATVSTGRRMWMIYLVLTFAFTGLIMLAGIPLWDSLNLVMVAIATGGFTVHAGGLAYYNNPMLEILLIPVMLTGAVPFKIFFLLYNGKVGAMFRDHTVRVLLLIAAVGSIITSLDLYIFSNIPLSTAFRQGRIHRRLRSLYLRPAEFEPACMGRYPALSCFLHDVYRWCNGQRSRRGQGQPYHHGIRGDKMVVPPVFRQQPGNRPSQVQREDCLKGIVRTGDLQKPPRDRRICIDNIQCCHTHSPCLYHFIPARGSDLRDCLGSQ
jgi:Trk-type K+ transport system membrane component